MPEIDQQFVEGMEDVLSVYARPYSKAEPVVCLDERPVQLLDPARTGLPIEPGKPALTSLGTACPGHVLIVSITAEKAWLRQAGGEAFLRALVARFHGFRAEDD